MAQKTQIVDLNKSYLVTDPNAFLENMIATEREDGEEPTFPILPYEGYNFLPTDYGYRSYFGQNSSLGVSALTSRTQFILNWQAPNLHEWLIALAEDGIWVVDTNVGGAWIHLVNHAYNVNEFKQWTFCTIENVVYFYKQGMDVVYHTAHNPSTFALELPTISPNFLNMAGQIGIFKAGTRLGFWDSLNSISWSSNFDLKDFTPSLETLAGNMLLNDVLGHIVSIKDSGEGFIVYASGSIVGVFLSSTIDVLWDAKKILGVGVLNPRSISYGKNTKEHWAWTTAGILKLGHYVPLSGKFEYEFLFPEVFDFLRESRNPVYIDCIQNRFVVFRVFSSRYLDNAVPIFTAPTTPVSSQQGFSPLNYNASLGAFVYDMDLKKWGKWKQESLCLVEFTGLKTGFNYTDLGMTAGLLHTDGKIYLFDHQPADSWIRYGKIGYYRLGMVHFLEGRIDFRNYATGTVEIDFSMDGRNIDVSLSQTYNYNAVLSYKMYPNQRSRWSTIKISGNYDLQYMEVRGNISCRR